MIYRSVLFLAMVAISCLSAAQTLYHRVGFVYDGDTILVEGGERVRYLGIDSPEMDHRKGKHEFMAEAARNFNLGLVAKARIRLEWDREKKDAHGRVLAYVFLENGTMVNELLVRQGLARVLFGTGRLKYRDLFLECQRKAMKEKLGIWSRFTQGDEKIYIGNRRFSRFHRPSCVFARKTSRSDLVSFQSRYDAFWAGYSPCKRCKP